MSNDYLEHHGVIGQRWGVRRYQNPDGSLTKAGQNRYMSGAQYRESLRAPNPNYSNEQRLRDQAVYGKGGVRRINRNMNKGYGVKGARSEEAARINAARRRGVTLGKASSVASGLAAYFLSDKAIDALNAVSGYKLDFIANDPVAREILKIGMSTVIFGMGYPVGHAIGMATGGYSPSKFRYS